MGDKGYDSEPLHEIVRENSIDFFAPLRKMNKKALSTKRPKEFFRRKCKESPSERRGMRSIVENVNYILNGTQITSLRSRKHSMRERELGWHLIFYNIKKMTRLSASKEA